jgi:hypothetical protein
MSAMKHTPNPSIPGTMISWTLWCGQHGPALSPQCTSFYQRMLSVGREELTVGGQPWSWQTLPTVLRHSPSSLCPRSTRGSSKTAVKRSGRNPSTGSRPVARKTLYATIWEGYRVEFILSTCLFVVLHIWMRF